MTDLVMASAAAESQPVLLTEVMAHVRHGVARPQVNVGRFLPHLFEEAQFVLFGRDRANLNARAIGSEAAGDPLPLNAQEGVRAADGAVKNGIIKDFGVAGRLAPREGIGRGDEGFDFARDAAAVPLGECRVAGLSLISPIPQCDARGDTGDHAGQRIASRLSVALRGRRGQWLAVRRDFSRKRPDRADH